MPEKEPSDEVEKILATKADPFAGTWRLDLGRSRFGGPMKPHKELTIVIEEQGDRGFDTIRGVAADGSPISDKYTFPNIGGEVKVLEGGEDSLLEPPGSSP